MAFIPVEDTTQDLRIDLLQARQHDLLLVDLQKVLSSPSPHLPSELWRFEKLLKPTSQSLSISPRHEKSALPVDQCLPGSPHIGSNHRKPSPHGFQDGERKSLPARREDKDLGPGEALGHIGTGTRKLTSGCDTKFLGKILHGTQQGAISEKGHPEVFLDFTQGAKQEPLIFLFTESSDTEDLAGPGAARIRQGGLGCNSIANGNELFCAANPISQG
jgi:hypothetical protein